VVSVYDPIEIGPVKLLVESIHSDNVQITFVVTDSDLDAAGAPHGVWVQDGQVNIPVRLWEQMKEAAK
jgi:hypothetical protein